MRISDWSSDVCSSDLEVFRKDSNLRCCAVVVACQEHDSAATMYGRILAKNASAQMVETLDQSCTSEGLLNDLGRRLSAQFVKGYAVGIGDVNNGDRKSTRLNSSH